VGLRFTAESNSNQLSGGKSAAVSARWTLSVTAAWLVTIARQAFRRASEALMQLS
jgi:hypothetical protein